MTALTAFGEQRRLRAHAQHLQSEQISVALSLMSKTLTLDVYAGILLTWGTGLRELETEIWPTCFALQEPNLLRAKRDTKPDIDLPYLPVRHTVLPCRLKESDDQAIAMSQTLASFMGFSTFCGGASFGGKVIARHLTITLRLIASDGSAFFC